MPTDDLLDDREMDRALRQLMPGLPPPAVATMRSELLAFIEDDDARHSDAVFGERHAVLDLERTTTSGSFRSARRRFGSALLAGAAAAALLVGLMAASRWRAPDAPASSTPTNANRSTGDQAPLLRPEVYPVLAPGDPLEGRAVARFDGTIALDNVPQASAVAVKYDGGRLVDAVVLTALAELRDDTFSGSPPTPTDVAGLELVGYYARDGDWPLSTLVLPGAPALAVTALEPARFVEDSSGIPITASIDDAGEVLMTVGDLPPGYVLLEPPARLARGASDGMLWAPDGDGPPDPTLPDPLGDEGDGVTARVSLSAPLYLLAADPQRVAPVDVSGRHGWIYRGELPGAPLLLWKVSDRTWAMVFDAASPEAALEFARSLDFVDETTWRQRYSVIEPLEPTVTAAPEATTGPVADAQPPATSAPSLIALEEIGSIPTDVPIGCGTTPYRDESVDSPVVAATPDDALAAFVDEVVPGLWPSGWTHIKSDDESIGTHRYEYHREDGLLVTVVNVEPVEGGWAATRWLSTPC